jgi:hypothetical protein
MSSCAGLIRIVKNRFRYTWIMKKTQVVVLIIAILVKVTRRYAQSGRNSTQHLQMEVLTRLMLVDARHEDADTS